MELHFTVNAADKELLIEAIKAGHRARQARKDAQLDAVGERLLASTEQVQQRWLPLCLLLAPLLAVIGVFYFSTHSVTPESGIALAIVALIYVVVWRRHASAWANAMLSRRARQYSGTWKPSSRPLEQTLDWSIRRALRSLEGKYVVSLGNLALTWRQAGNKAMTLPWHRIESLHETDTFYQVIARPVLSRRTSYFLPKHSSDMNDADYQSGITLLRQRIVNR